MKISLKICTAVLLAATTLPIAAQTNGSNSPYSRYGFGLLGDGSNAFNKAMSGTAYGMRNGTQLNTKNPASYASIDSLSFLFDFGMSLQNANISQSGVKTNAKNTSIDYVTLGFRAAKNLGMSVGLVPYSTIGYDASSSQTITEGDGNELKQTTAFSGDGGLHEVYAGVGWMPFRNFSVGANVGYLWGDLSHTVLMSFDETSVYSTRQVYSTDLRTYKIDFGLQYAFAFDKHNSFVLGLTYGLGHNINTRASFYNQKVHSGSVTGGDSLYANNAYQLPHSFGVGLTWEHKNSLRVGADYTFQKWSSVKYPQVVSDGINSSYTSSTGLFTNMHKVAVGCEYVPNPNGIRWRQLIRYRAGFSFATPYTRIDGVDGPRDYTASVGVSLPIINIHSNRSLLNISAQYEHVAPKMAGMITENYLRVCIGLSFNEKWFMKWKVE